MRPEKNIIFCFSATGNSLFAAKIVAEEIKNTSIIAINQEINAYDYLNKAYNCVGFVFPVHAFGMPIVVDNFIRKIKDLNAKYVFALITYGLIFGNALDDFKKTIRQEASLFSVKMPNNDIFFGKTANDRQTEKIIKEAERKLKLLALYISAKKKHSYKIQPFTKHIYSSIYNLWKKRVNKLDRWFWTNKNCNNCRICVKICPVNNITIDEKPKWLGRCTLCSACFNWCPQHAIQYGKITKNKKQYTNQFVNLSEIIRNNAG